MKWRLLLFLLLITNAVCSQKSDFEKALDFIFNQDFDSALPLLKIEAEKGNARAMHELGNLFYLGNGVEEDGKTAFEWYLKSAQNNCSSSMNMLGRYYAEGWHGVGIDSVSAVSWIKKSAESGDSIGQFNYACMLYIGELVKSDDVAARLWFGKSLKTGFKPASLYLGYIYYYGYGTDKDPERAFRYFSMNDEDPENSFMLGECFRLGKGVAVDKEKSLNYYMQAVDGNQHTKALKTLGDLYYLGNFLPQDRDVARRYYEIGLNSDEPDFNERLALLFPDFSSYNEAQLYKLAVHYYASNPEPMYDSVDELDIQAADTVYRNSELYKTALELSVSKKYIPAILKKATHLYYGDEGYAADKKEALKLALPYAKENLTASNLAAMYYEEKNDPKEAFKFTEISATIHHSKNAKNKLAQFYENGLGVKQDIRKALQYYREIEDDESASELCSKHGIKDETEYANLMNEAFSDKNYTALFELSREGASEGYAYCRYILAYCYIAGLGVEVDNNKAVELLEPVKNQDEATQMLLARAYESAKREKEAFLIYESLADAGYVAALPYLSKCYVDGVGTPQHVQKGVAVLQQGVDKYNDAFCLHDLAFMQEFGIGVKKDVQDAFRKYEESIKLNYTYSKNNLALCYLRGAGVEMDKNKAIQMMESEMEQDNPDSYRNLGECYLLGDGVKANYSKAVSYFEKSQKYYMSKLFLAICYELGLGVERDIQKSRLLLSEIDNRYLKIFPQKESIVYEYQGIPGFTTRKITVSTSESNGFLQRNLTVYYPNINQTIAPEFSAIPVSSSQLIAQNTSQVNNGQTPEIFITNYNDGDTFSDSEVELIYRFFPSTCELTEFDIKINGETAPKQRGFSKQGELSLLLPGKDSRIDVTPYNQYGKGITTTLYLKWLPKQDIRPDLYVLAIGIDDYKFYSKLKYPIKDMTSFISILQNKTNSLYKNVDIQRISNDEVTIRNIKKELSKLIGKVQEEDFVFIYYAGHGDVHDDQYYFIPIDGEKSDIRSTCLKSSDFMDDVNSIKGKVVLFVDACYSGNLILSRSNFSSDMYDALSTLRKIENDVYIFTSSAGRTKSLESEEWQGGLFTKVLLDAFRGKARRSNETILTTERLRQYLIEEMKKIYKEQTPRFSSMPDFPLLVY